MINDLRQAILIASLGLTTAVALPHAEEIGERTAENLPYVALAGACLYGSVKFTRSMLWYEQGGVDLSQAQSKQSLRGNPWEVPRNSIGFTGHARWPSQ